MKKIIKSLLILLLVLAIGIALVACVEPDLEDDDPEEEIEDFTRSQLITNGTFYNVSNATGSKNYIKENVASWDVTTGTLSKGYDGVASGAIDMANKELFERERNKFNLNNTLQYPGIDPQTPKEKDDPEKLQDNNALLLSSIKSEGSIYYKNSNDFTLQTNKYYKLQFSVLTDIDLTDVEDEDRDKKGAWVIFDGAIYQEFASINTNGEWQTYEVYIQSSDYDATRSLKARLWLGHGPEKIRDQRDSTITNPYLTKGTVLFDNIICQEIDEYTESDFQNLEETETIKKSSMIFPDMNFVQQSEKSISSYSEYFYSFRSGTNSTDNAVNYNLVEGKTGLTANKPSVNKSYTGIVDMSQMYRFDESEEGDDRFIDTYQYDFKKTTFEAPAWNSFYELDDATLNFIEERENILMGDTKALMIYHNDLSGAGFVSNKQLLIRKNTFYTIKVWAYVWEVDRPEPKSSDVGTQPTAPGDEEERPTEESLEPLEDNMLNLEAEYLWKRVRVLEELDFNDDLSVEQQERILEIDNDAEAVERLEGEELVDLKDAYDEAKEEYQEAFDLFEEWEEYTEKNETYLEKVAAFNEKYDQWENANSKPSAQFKITGAGDLDPVKTQTTGQWEQLTFYLNGNQLSNRKVNLEFWFGEGTNVDYANLMMGGVFFDDITIEVSSAPEAGKDYQELSPFDADDENVDIGGLFDEAGDIKFSKDNALTEDDLWEKELADGASLSNEDYLNYSIVEDTSYPIVLGGETKYYNVIQMENLDYTAGILNYRGGREILANKCYRLSLWVWTADIAKGLGAKIELMAKAQDSSEDKMSSVSSFADFNYEEGQEVVFYIRGDTLKNNLVGLKFTLGEGNRFDTEKYIKGTLFASAITLKEIEYSEYNASSKSGDQTKSYAFSNTTPSSSASVTNANFGTIKLEDIEKDAINDKGELVGVAPTSSWTIPTSSAINTNGFNKPSISHKKIDEIDYITWKHVVDADGIKADAYEIYIQNTVKAGEEEGDDDEDVDSLYIGYVDEHYDTEEADAGTDYFYRYRIKSKAMGNFVVRAVSDTGIGTYSNTLGNPVTSKDNLDEYFEEFTSEDSGYVPKKEYKIGTINYETYGKTDLESAGIYADNMFANSSYKSPYKTMFMMQSNYGIRANVTAASKSLSADTYYEISVWLKTLNGAKASISFKDISAILETRDEQVGFINQDTNAKWAQYRFYIATGEQSSNIQLQLSMGNPYGKGRPGTDTETTRMYDEELSKGIIFFDNVNITTLTAEQYEEKSTKQTDNEEVGEYYTGNEVFHNFEMVYTNKFAYKVLSYTTDSFDSYTDNTVTEEFDTDGKYKEGFYRGNTPKAYSWSRATDGSTTDMDRLYGVYSYQDITSNDHPLMSNDTNSDAFADLIDDDFDLATFIRITGYNSLVMSNLVTNGQMYTLSSSRTLSAKTYYKLTFKAKTLLAEDDYAEFRFMYEGDNEDYEIIKINTIGNDIDEYTEYTMYVYNELDTTKSVKWSFNLGGDAEDEKIIGMFVIDDVKLEKTQRDVYEEAERAFGELDEDSQLLSATQFYQYEEEDSTPGGDDEEPPQKPEKTSIFDRGDIWLLISTIVIGSVILITVVIVLIKRFRKKHPKKVKGENVVKTEKVIEPTPAKDTEKDDIINEDEFIDKAEEEKPKYVQRVLPKKKKKKK